MVNPPSPPPVAAPTVGTRLAGRYELVRFIARGGMAEVYEAVDGVLDRRVAVKLFRAAEAVDRQRFDGEVLLLASLSHPGLVGVYDAGEHGGDGFVVLELVEGPTLGQCLTERGALPPDEVVPLGVSLADALAYVHERGIVHRDLTPSNILCAPDGQPRLTDFGIARLLDTSRVTAPSTTVGTAAYMAPEQVEGRDVTPTADVYALGLVLLEALVGSPAFSGQPHEAAVARLVRDPDIPATVPAAWAELLRAMTARDAAARPSAREVYDRLRSLPATGALGAAASSVLVPAPEGAAPDPAMATTTLPAAESGIDLHADTVALAAVAASETSSALVPPRGGTAVMPAAMAPVTGGPPPARTRPAWHRGRGRWLALAAVALLAILALSAGSGGWTDPVVDARSATTTTTTAPAPVVTTAPPTTAAPVAPAPSGGGEGKGRGKGRKD